MPPEEDQAMTTDKLIFDKAGHVVSEICECGQRDRHTDMLITILCDPTRGRVIIKHFGPSQRQY